jgi:mono/diheme cytochrome c family protein
MALGLAGLAIPMGMGTGSGMHRGGGMGPGMMGGGMGPGMMGGGMGPGMMGGSGWDGGPPGSGPAVRDRTGNPVEDTPESIARGRAAYQARCAVCHGEQARGDGPAAAGFARPPANLEALAGWRPDRQLYTTLTYGWGAMPAFGGSLTEQARWDVVNYLQSLQREGAGK